MTRFSKLQQDVSETWEQLASFTIQELTALHMSVSSILGKLDHDTLPFLRYAARRDPHFAGRASAFTLVIALRAVCHRFA